MSRSSVGNGGGGRRRTGTGNASGNAATANIKAPAGGSGADPSDATKELRLNLLENGLDFVREGTETLYGTNANVAPRAYKYALLHVFSGTLLLLKERLRRGHPSLIFVDVSHQGTPEAKTVDFDTALKRLSGALGVTIDRADQDLLRRVQKERNSLEHFEARIEVQHANALVGELVEFLERFLREQLNESLFTHISPSAGAEIAELAKIAERLRVQALAEWQSRADRYRKYSAAKLNRLAEEHAYHPKHNPDSVLLECPNCGMDSVAQVEEGVMLCTNTKCRDIHRSVSCHRCGGAAFDGEDFCADCRSYIQYQMDRD